MSSMAKPLKRIIWTPDDLGNAITLDVESGYRYSEQFSPRCAGHHADAGLPGVWITRHTTVLKALLTAANVFTDTLVVKDSVLPSGAYSDLGYQWLLRSNGRSRATHGETNATAADDAALIVVAGASDNAMQTTLPSITLPLPATSLRQHL